VAGDHGRRPARRRRAHLSLHRLLKAEFGGVPHPSVHDVERNAEKIRNARGAASTRSASTPRPAVWSRPMGGLRRRVAPRQVFAA